MDREAFEKLVAEVGMDAVPEKFRSQIENVAFLIEDEPSPQVRKEEGLGPNETLLGLYHGIPHTARGDLYGLGGTLPDTITLFRLPLLMEAQTFLNTRKAATPEDAMRLAIRETIWHEVAHHFGMDEREVREREHERDEEK